MQPRSEQAELFGTLRPLVVSKIGRPIDDTETRALAFTADRLFSPGMAPENFLANIMGITALTPREAAMQVHNKVYETKLAEIARLMAANPADAPRLAALRENIQIGHNQTVNNVPDPAAPIYIGGVSNEWIPDWYTAQAVKK